MTAIGLFNLRLQNARDFLENFVGHPIIPPSLSGSHAVDRNHYLFVARSKPWPNLPLAVPPISELSPPTAVDSQHQENEAWDAMLGMKLITQTFTSLVLKRHDWDTTGDTIYFPYDDRDGDLYNHPTNADVAAAALAGTYTAGSFYVITDEFHVFKCLNNNNRAHSTQKPTKPLSAPFIVSLSDGYQWKYMYTVTPAQTLRFLTDQWLPVHTLGAIADDGSTQWQVENTAVDGSVSSYIIDSAGSGYTNIYSGTLVSAGSNTAVLPGGASSTTGAYVGCSIFITAGTGFPSSPRLITSYDGPTRTATLDASWTADGTTQFDILPTVVLTGDGTGASAKLVIPTTGPSAFTITGVLVTNAGSGYRTIVANITGGLGIGGVNGSIRGVISPNNGHGHDAEKELGAFFVMAGVTLAYNEGAGDFPISNDYRQIGIIRDLRNFDGTLANATTRTALKSLNLTGVNAGLGGDFQGDEIITGTLGPVTAQAYVVQFDSTGVGTGTIHFFQDETTGYTAFSDGMSITGAISGATGTVGVAGVVNAEVQKNSGEMLYIENRRPILRAPDQQEDLRAIIEF